MEEPKKLTFGFSKVIKKPNLQARKLEEPPKKEMIKCLEGKSIQLVEEKVEEKPLVIPLLDSRKTSAALASLQKRREVLDGVEPEEQAEEHKSTEIPPTSDNSLESKAVRELLSEANQEPEENDSKLVLPLKPEELPLDGAKESSIDDYENIPINQFGLAMLRGMGWKDQPKKKGPKDLESPFVRPKGMGLGADKAIKAKPLLVAPEHNEILEIKKNAYIRILAGKHKDLYGQVEGLDEHGGRVIVKMALGGTKESFNEFLLQPVPKKEFQTYGKVINAEKYDKYKKMENEFGQIKVEKLEGVKKEVKNERKSEDRWKHDKYDENKKRSSPRRSKYDDKSPRNHENKSRDESSRKDDRYDSKREENYGYRKEDRYESRDSRNEHRYESRDSQKEDREYKDSRSDDRYGYRESRRDDRFKDDRRDYLQDDRYKESRKREESRRRSSSEESNKYSKHKSKKSSKNDSDSEDGDYRRKHKKKSSKSKKSYKTDSSEDESRSKKSKKSKKQRSRSRSRGRR